MDLGFILNGEAVSIEIESGESLLTALRERLGLRSMKDGCAPEGSCGACTVIVDGHAVVSCAQPAERVAGKHVTTLEGLEPARREAWADAFVGTGAVQCGYCTPGIVMKAEALLARNAAPTRDVIRHSLAGNLCRCTGYVKVVEAIERVARGAAAGVPGSGAAAVGSGASGSGAAGGYGQGGVGERAPRKEARAATLGEQQFVRDMTVPGMLHGALRFSDHPRALVRRIDTSAAAAMPGVVRIATWRDVPGERHQGLLVRDWPAFVAEGEETRYVGDALAAVAATTRAAARRAAAAIEVEYEVLEPVTDPGEALRAESPAVHASGNLLEYSEVKRGDVDAALAASAHVVSDVFETQRIEHAFLEPEACLAVPGSERPRGDRRPAVLRIYSQGQGAWEDRRQIASLLGLPEGCVRVTQVATGGAFGGKEDLSVQGQTALLALLTECPVHLALTRAESMRVHPKRHPFRMEYTAGCDAEGRLTAVRARIVGDTGAYASVGGKVLERAAGHACGAYRVPNVDVEARAVYTNNPPCGAMRGFGVVQVTFAIEGLLDRLAELTGLDGWEIRWRNALGTGDRFGTGQRLGRGVGLKRTLLAVRDAYREARSEGRAAGIACGAKNTGIGNGVVEHGRAILRPESDGSVTLYHSWTEMGQGINTALAQIAAEELGIPVDLLRVLVDTERELDTGETTASRGTSLGGQAVIDAARRLKATMVATGCELADLAGQESHGEYTVDWTTATTRDAADPVTHFAYGWATQVVILDEQGRLARVIAAQDVGRAINPAALEGQVEGGVHMGLGLALTEELPVAAGVPSSTLKSLGIIPPSGMPPVEAILVQEPQPEGPFGAKGAGEAVLVPTPAAVAGAVYAFDGIRRTKLPMRDSAAARSALPRLATTHRGTNE